MLTFIAVACTYAIPCLAILAAVALLAGALMFMSHRFDVWVMVEWPEPLHRIAYVMQRNIYVWYYRTFEEGREKDSDD